MKSVIVLIGAGSIGQAIARRVGAGKHVVLADLQQENADAAAKTLNDAGFDVTTAIVDVSSRSSVHALVEAASALGDVSGVIHAAGVSPSQAPPEVDPQGRSLRHCARAGGVRQRHRARRRGRRHRVAVRASAAAALGRAEHGPGNDAGGRAARASDAAAGPGQDSLHAYQISKRGNSLRVDGRSGALGQARRARQHDQPRHHHHPARQRRAQRGHAAPATGA